MHFSRVFPLLAVAFLGAGAASLAQTPAAENPLDAVIASRGGIPLIVGGKLIGAIGCSGGTGSQDEVACKAGAAAVK
jgi:uncharacterized protein GlcG (DUF336 family)